MQCPICQSLNTFENKIINGFSTCHYCNASSVIGEVRGILPSFSLTPQQIAWLPPRLVVAVCGHTEGKELPFKHFTHYSDGSDSEIAFNEKTARVALSSGEKIGCVLIPNAGKYDLDTVLKAKSCFADRASVVIGMYRARFLIEHPSAATGSKYLHTPLEISVVAKQHGWDIHNFYVDDKSILLQLNEGDCENRLMNNTAQEMWDAESVSRLYEP